MNISVIGLGKLGAPLAALLASKGHRVIGVDLNETFVTAINQGRAPVEEPQLQDYITKGRALLSATTSYVEAISQTELTFIIVPTPSNENGLFSNAYILSAINEIGKVLKTKKSYHVINITSTVIPGSTNGEIRAALEKSSGLEVGRDIGLCYNPEFIALGSVIQNMLFPDAILLGESDKLAGDILESVYHSVCENDPPIQRMNLVNAEITKISVNTFVTTKISYANMLSDLCDHYAGADVDVVTSAVGLDSRIGRKYLRGAVAYGGPCFPRDNSAFVSLAASAGIRADLAIATDSINDYQTDRLVKCINKHVSPKKTIAILGLSYKPDTYVVDASQGIQLANELAEHGFKVSVYDPMALDAAKPHLHNHIEICDSIAYCVNSCDTIVVMIPWPHFKQFIEPGIFPNENPRKVLIDCWRVLNKKDFIEANIDIVYLGYGNYAPNNTNKSAVNAPIDTALEAAI
jgi:UDPglucose 6-dehydrogenase